MPCLRVHGKSCTSLVLCLEKRRLFNNHCGKHMRHCNSAGRDMDGVVLCRRRSLVLLFLGWASVAGAFSPAIYISLANASADASAGRLLVGKPEFSADGTILGLAWGSVCADDSWTDAAATVVCRQLSLTFVGEDPDAAWDRGKALVPGVYGPGGHDPTFPGDTHPASQPVIMAQVNCTGREYTLGECKYVWRPPAGSVTCKDHTHDAAVQCYRSPPPPPAPPSAFPVIAARLVSMSPYQVQGSVGRLEVDLGSGWRSVCAAGMSEAAVQVVCRQLNLTGGILVRGAFAQAQQDPEYRPVAVLAANCTGSESSLGACVLNTTSDPGVGAAQCPGQWGGWASQYSTASRTSGSSSGAAGDYGVTVAHHHHHHRRALTGSLPPSPPPQLQPLPAQAVIACSLPPPSQGAPSYPPLSYRDDNPPSPPSPRSPAPPRPPTPPSPPSQHTNPRPPTPKRRPFSSPPPPKPRTPPPKGLKHPPPPPASRTPTKQPPNASLQPPTAAAPSGVTYRPSPPVVSQRKPPPTKVAKPPPQTRVPAPKLRHPPS